MGSRGSEYDNGIKKIANLIDEFISNPSNIDATMSYLNAINKRSKEAVMALDKKLKEGKFGTGENQEKLSKIRKELLSLAKDNPNEIQKLYDDFVKKAWTKLPLDEKVKRLAKKYKGKKFRLNKDYEIHQYPYTYGVKYPAGLEGTVLKVTGSTYGGGEGSVLPKTESFEFLLDFNGYKKWVPSDYLELIKND